jgi:hypothetical protein
MIKFAMGMLTGLVFGMSAVAWAYGYMVGWSVMKNGRENLLRSVHMAWH